MKSIQSALFLAFAILLAGCGSEDPPALIASAKEYMAKRDFGASIIQLKNALQKEPQNAEARYLLGVASLESGDVASAEIELGKAMELGLASDEVQVAVARTLLAKGDTGKVIAEFGPKRLASPARQAELRALVGLAQLARNRREDAQATFSEALALDSNSVNAKLGMARFAGSAQDLPTALTWVDKALAAAPANFEAHLVKADLLAAQGQAGPAEKAYRDSINAAPDQVAPRFSLISHLMRSRALDKAGAELDALAKIAPKDLRTIYARALLLLEQRQFPQARDAILQVLKMSPDHVPSLVLAGTAAFETGAYAEAEGYLRKAVYNAPNALAAKRLLAATRLRMGQVELALSEVQELLQTAGKDPNVLALAGEASLARGNIAAAARYYEQAKSLAPDNAALQTRLAQIRFASGDAARAISELEATSAAHPAEYQADLALVASYLRQRQADQALQALKDLEKKQPDNPLTHHLRGLAHVLKRDFPDARASFERALQLRPTYMPAVTHLARLDLREKKTDAAKKRYEEVLKKEPNNEQALGGLAVLLRIGGAHPPEVEKLLKRAVVANPNSASARLSLINFHFGSRDFASALAAAQEAQAALPKSPPIVEALGVTQLAAGEARQAVGTFVRLSEMLPRSPEPLVRLASAYVAVKDPDNAVKSLRAALALRPELMSVQRDITAVFVASGRMDAALREARTVQAKHPKQPLGFVLEAEVYLAQKNLERAEQLYRDAVKRFDLPLLVARSHSLTAAKGSVAEADAMAENWIKVHPDDTAVLSYLAERDLIAKRYGSAVKRYRVALERHPDHPQVLNNLAWAANELKHPEALEYAERAHELAPDNAAIMDTLGSILAQRGESERGLELLARATELAPDAHRVRLNFAKALIKAGRKNPARKELEALAKLDSRLPVQQEAAALLADL